MQIIVRQASGKYGIPMHKLSNLIEMLQNGPIPMRTICFTLRKYLPDHVHISSTTIHNFKVKVKGLSAIESNDKDLIKINLSECPTGDLTDDEICQFLSEIFEESGWDVLNFLKKLKENNSSFDYRLKYDKETNRPSAVVWMTGTMKQNWKMYGDAVFLDMQKRV